MCEGAGILAGRAIGIPAAVGVSRAERHLLALGTRETVASVLALPESRAPFAVLVVVTVNIIAVAAVAAGNTLHTFPLACIVAVARDRSKNTTALGAACEGVEIPLAIGIAVTARSVSAVCPLATLLASVVGPSTWCESSACSLFCDKITCQLALSGIPNAILVGVATGLGLVLENATVDAFLFGGTLDPLAQAVNITLRLSSVEVALAAATRSFGIPCAHRRLQALGVGTFEVALTAAGGLSSVPFAVSDDVALCAVSCEVLAAAHTLPNRGEHTHSVLVAAVVIVDQGTLGLAGLRRDVKRAASISITFTGHRLCRELCWASGRADSSRPNTHGVNSACGLKCVLRAVIAASGVIGVPSALSVGGAGCFGLVAVQTLAGASLCSFVELTHCVELA